MASVWGELKRRNVVKVAVAYAIVGWILVEVSSTVFPIVQLPDWTVTFLTMLILFGFPIALILSWAYEITPDGMKRSHEVEATESITHVTGRKLDFAIIGALMLALGFVVYNYVLDQPPGASAGSVDRRSIAVLPFSNESAAEENAEFFANGMHDNLLTQLARISALKVISRTSVMEYRDTTKNMRQIGQELGVATILEGGVQRAGNALQINVQLIDVETDEHLWAEVYDRELTAENIFAIQREMATSIAEALQATLSPQEIAQLNEVPTQSTRALEFYLRGKEYQRRDDELTFMPLAVEQLERAVDEDAQFGLAWAALARAYSELHFLRVNRPESRRNAEEALQRAVEFAPDAPETHFALGRYQLGVLRNHDNALREFAIAEQGMPGNSELIAARAFTYRQIGEWQQSLSEMERAIALDPRNVEQIAQQGVSYSILRDYGQAEAYLERALEIAPDDAQARWYLARIPVFRDGNIARLKEAVENAPLSLGRNLRNATWNVALYERDYELALNSIGDREIDGRSEYVPNASFYGVAYQLAEEPELAEPLFQAARTQVEEALASSPDDPRLLIALGEALIGLGENEAAVRAAVRAIERIPSVKDAPAEQSMHAQSIVKILGPAGDVETAVAQLDAYLSRPGYWSIEGLLPDPRLDPIRDDPHFQALVEKYRRQ